MADNEDPVYVLTVDMPGLRKGEKLTIDGLGVVSNGHEREVTKEAADNFRAHGTTTKVKTDDDGNPVVVDDQYVFETVQGPTLLQAFQDSDHVTVVKYEKPKPPGNQGNQSNQGGGN